MHLALEQPLCRLQAVIQRKAPLQGRRPPGQPALGALNGAMRRRVRQARVKTVCKRRWERHWLCRLWCRGSMHSWWHSHPVYALRMKQVLIHSPKWMPAMKAARVASSSCAAPRRACRAMTALLWWQPSTRLKCRSLHIRVSMTNRPRNWLLETKSSAGCCFE